MGPQGLRGPQRDAGNTEPLLANRFPSLGLSLPTLQWTPSRGSHRFTPAPNYSLHSELLEDTG